MCKAIKHKSIVRYLYKLGTRTMSVVDAPDKSLAFL